MILEAIRITRDWLDDSTNPNNTGVNAMLALVARDGGDASPATAEFADETRTDQLAWGRLPSPTVAGRLVITVELARIGGTVDASIMPPIRQGDVPLIIRVVRQSSAAATAVRDGMYVARAVLWSLNNLNTNTAAAQRTRNNIALMHLDQITILPLYHREEDVEVVVGFVVRCLMRDLKPLST